MQRCGGSPREISPSPRSGRENTAHEGERGEGGGLETGETPTEWDVTGFTRRRGSKVVSIGAGGRGRGKRKFPRVRRQAFYYTYVWRYELD